jgi:hypothetical protein
MSISINYLLGTLLTFLLLNFLFGEEIKDWFYFKFFNKSKYVGSFDEVYLADESAKYYYFKDDIEALRTLRRGEIIYDYVFKVYPEEYRIHPPQQTGIKSIEEEE